MSLLNFLLAVTSFLPIPLLAANGVIAKTSDTSVSKKWHGFSISLISAILSSIAAFLINNFSLPTDSTLLYYDLFAVSNLQLLIALLVSILGFVIGSFSSRYLQGEQNQATYISCISLVLASVQLLLLSNHWLVLIAAWAAIGLFMQPLLCFYKERPFAQLASHKKSIADRVADVLLLIAAGFAWFSVGSGTLSDLSFHLAQWGSNALLNWSAVLLVLSVIIRTALLPVHGWLIQVMEAPTPVSALLHAGVINLSGFILIRFANLLEAVPFARGILVIFGLSTALLAGIAMLTRASVKVRLAWSTVAQMGFMLLECALGLYTFAAIHLIGHSIYKANAFLSSSSSVKECKLRQLNDGSSIHEVSMLLAPLIAWLTVIIVQSLTEEIVLWPWWWSVVIALAWAPVLWISSNAHTQFASAFLQMVRGVGIVSLLTLMLALTHLLPLHLIDRPLDTASPWVIGGMGLFYILLVMYQLEPKHLERVRRLAYAGFYLDEIFTKLTLKYWPVSIRPNAKES